MQTSLRTISTHASQQFLFVYKPYGLSSSTIPKCFRISAKGGERNLGIPVPLLDETRGMMCVTLNLKMYQLLDTMMSNSLIKRTYVVVCERLHATSQSFSSMRGGERKELRFSLISKSITGASSRSLRLANLFVNRPVLIDNHPFIDASRLLQVKPEHTRLYMMSTKDAKHGNSYNSDDVWATYRTLDSSDHFILLEVNLHRGTENGLRCVLNTIGFPVVGDLRYNKNDIDVTWANYLGVKNNGNKNRNNNSTLLKPEYLYDEIVRNQHLARIGLTMCCTGLSFPDVFEEKNLIQLKHKKFHNALFSKEGSNLFEKKRADGTTGMENADDRQCPDDAWKWYKVTSPFPEFFQRIVREDSLVPFREDEYHPESLSNGENSDVRDSQEFLLNESNASISSQGLGDPHHTASSICSENTCLLCGADHHYLNCPVLRNEDASQRGPTRTREQKKKKSGKFCICCGNLGHTVITCSTRKRSGCRVCGEMHMEELCPQKKPLLLGNYDIGLDISQEIGHKKFKELYKEIT